MFKKYPFIKQKGLKDCGVASLMMIIKYYKGKISFEELRDLTKTNKNGTTAYHVMEAANKLGFDAKGIKCKLEDLNEENIVLPAIAHVVIDKTYNHFVVIYKINFKKKTLLIADPNNKLKTIKFEEFEKIWQNILIVLYPLYSLKKYKENLSIITFVLRILKYCSKELKNIWLLSLFITIFSILTSFFLKYMIDSTILKYPQNHLFSLFIIFFVIYILLIITDYFRNKVLIYLNELVSYILTANTFKQIIQLPYIYYCNRTTGEVISRINDLTSVNQVISKVFYSIFIDLPLALFVLFILASINLKLFGIVLILLTLYIINIIIFKPINSHYIKSIQEKRALVSSYMVEGISNFETIKALNLENKIITKFENLYLKLLTSSKDGDRAVNNQYIFKEAINKIGFIIIIYLGTLLILKNQLTVGQLLTFNSLLIYFFEPINNIISVNSNISEAINSIKRILDLYYYREEKGIVKELANGNLNLKNLNYSYNDQNLILNKINLKINKGSKVLIVGSSGSGKSTLLKIIMKYYEVERSQVFLNNIDINDYILADYRKGISYISQQESLFTGTLINNFNLINKDETKIIDIAKMCEVDKIIKKTNTGYKMLIEEDGYNISGGEKQRIILARSLLKPFNILLIDEGMSQMDINLERRILKKIFEKYKDKTIIVVSHRLANADLFDKLVELENGKIKKEVFKNG